MKNAWHYPLPLKALDEYCHPSASSVFHTPRHHRPDTETLAGNGYLAIRVERGGWTGQELEAADEQFLRRFDKIPWGRWKYLDQSRWVSLDQYRSSIYKRGQIGPFLSRKGGTYLMNSPVWMVNLVKVRLSLLQIVAKLPRPEIYAGSIDSDSPLWFRFNGGRGAIARDKRLQKWSREILKPKFDRLDGKLC